MKVSEERIKELVGASGLEPCDFDPVWDSLMVGEVVSMARELLALRKAREGWKLVPVDPTAEMLEEIWLDERFKEVAMKRRYQAMLAASPTPHE